MGLFGKQVKAEKKEAEKEVELRKEESEPIVRKILELVHLRSLPIGQFENVEEKAYDEVAKEVIQFMLDNNMKYSNKDFVFQLAFQPLEKLRDRVVNSLKRTFEDMVERAVGKDALAITLEDMEKIIKGQKSE